MRSKCSTPTHRWLENNTPEVADGLVNKLRSNVYLAISFATKDADADVGLAVQTLAKMRVTGDSPPFHKVGRQAMYDRGDLDAWLDARRRRSTSDGDRATRHRYGKNAGN